MIYSKLTLYDPFIYCGSHYSIEVLKTGIVINDGCGESETIPYKNIFTLKYIPFLSPHIILSFTLNGERWFYTVCSSTPAFKRIKCLYNEMAENKGNT